MAASPLSRAAVGLVLHRMSRVLLRPSALLLNLLVLLVLSPIASPPSSSALFAAAYKPLSDHFLRLVPNGGDDFDVRTGRLLAPLLVPRVPGTPGQARAQEHLAGFFRDTLPRWQVLWQNSTSRTPATGDRDVPFANLIFRREPPWVTPGQANLLTLVAHYDSRIAPEGFVGAIDSAAPCAMLMHAARTIDGYLTQMHDEMDALGEGGSPDMDMGVQIVFMDGEEAFVSWTDQDSLYGARSLANEWENTAYLPVANFPNALNQISLFVLLDLLGSPAPRVSSYFPTTHWAYRNMASIEQRMRRLGLLESAAGAGSRPFLPDAARTAAQFGAQQRSTGIGDDHVPFLARGAPVLHVIDAPFPAVWHTLRDDGDHLDLPTVRDWARIVAAFALEWLDMMEVEPPQAEDGPLPAKDGPLPAKDGPPPAKDV